MDKPENNRRKKPKGLPPSKAHSLPKPKKASKVKKNKEDSKKPESTDSSSSQENPLDIVFPDGLMTLLPTKNRKTLPQIPQRVGPKCKLIEIVLHAPDLYVKMIEKLRLGVSPTVAAEICGIGERTFYDWGEKGAQDANHLDPETGELDPLDTYYSRFYFDCRRAMAVKAGECEATIAVRDPGKWLSRGPGRIFGGRWGKNPERPAIPTSKGSQGALPAPDPDEVIDATFTVNHGTKDASSSNVSGIPNDPSTNPAVHQGNGVPNGQLKLSPTQEYEALKVLEGIGLITLNDSLKKAYEEQLSLENVPKEDPEPTTEEE